MRVSSNDIIKQGIHYDKASKIFKPGDIVKGRVISYENGIITLKTTGERIVSVLLLSDEKIAEDTNISFMINEISEDKIYAKLLEYNEFNNIPEKSIISLIDELGVPRNELNKEIVEKLLKYMQYIDKDKIEYINFLLKTIDNIMQNKEKMQKGLLLSEEDIHELPVGNLNKILTMDDRIDLIDVLLKKFNLENKDDFIKDIIETFELQKNISDDLKSLIYQSNKIIDLVRFIDLESISYFVSKDMSITSQDVNIFTEIVEEDKGFDFFINKLIDALKSSNDKELESTSKELLQIFTEAKEINGKTYKNLVNRVIDIAKSIEEIIERKDIRNIEIRDNIQNLKSFLNILKSINNHINYFNIPLLLNSRESSVDIYIYKEGKRSKKIDISDVNILISLNLENLGHIEGFLQISNKVLNIAFKTESKIVSSFLNQNSITLRDILMDKGYTANISVGERKDSKTNLLNFEDRFISSNAYKYGIDVRL